MAREPKEQLSLMTDIDYARKESPNPSSVRRFFVKWPPSPWWNLLFLGGPVLIGLVLSLALPFVLRTWRAGSVNPSASQMAGTPGPLPVMFSVPEFALTERSKEEVTLADLDGKVWIADFFFTSCAGPCALMSANMAKLQEQLADAGDLRFVSITVDPKRDTPEELRKYASKFKADRGRWLFLTGKREAIYDLCAEKGFRLAAPKTDAAATDDGHLIVHSTRFVLVDRAGQIRGYYDGTDDDDVKRIAADARRLIEEAPPP